MSFCSSRNGDKFNNRDVRYSARSLTSSINYGGSYLELSSRSYDTSKSSYKYANSIGHMENNALRNASIENNLHCTTMPESRSDIVPPLDLKSEENYPTTRDYTFSYRKHCEAARIVLKPDKAYETWLSAKRKILSDKKAIRKNDEEMKQREIEERQRLAKEQYEKWLKKKSQTSISLKSTKTHSNAADTKIRPKLPNDEATARLEEWKRAKRLKEEHDRMVKRQEEQRRIELEEQRRQMAAEAWNNWIANASKKPKPVPLNRGMLTLRGTVSDIFVNPNEWKPIIPT